MTDKELETLLTSELQDEMPCEHPDHENKKVHDNGPGTYYVRLECSNCEYVLVQLVCTKLAQGYWRLLNEEPDLLYPYCARCDVDQRIGDILDALIRK